MEIAVLLVLIVANGVFAAAEMALVASKKGTLLELASQGNGAARVAIQMMENPTRFLSSVQVGITLIGILAGVFGGTTLSRELAPHLGKLPGLAPYASGVSLALVIGLISFLSLVFGELIPKRLALHAPERMVLLLARPMRNLSYCVGPVISLLSLTTDAVLKLCGISPRMEPPIAREEIRTLVEQGHHVGGVSRSEIELAAAEVRTAAGRDHDVPFGAASPPRPV